LGRVLDCPSLWDHLLLVGVLALGSE